MTKYKNLKKTLLTIGIFRVFIIVLNFSITALLIRLLGVENYGIYMSLFSIFAWMFLIDLGLGKGMRNFVTLALSKHDFIVAKQYISTTYISIGILSLLFYCVTILLILNSNLSDFFNLKVPNEQILITLFILITFFFIRFVLALIDQILYATHNSNVVTVNNFNATFLYFIGLMFLYFFSLKSMEDIAFVFGISTILAYILIYFWFFIRNVQLLPKIKYFSLTYLKKILNHGYQILFIQLGFLLVLGLDRLIILKYIGASDAAMYDIIYKVMAILLLPFSVVAQPLWSSYAEAYEHRDYSWIKSIYKKLYIMIFGMLIGVILLTFFFDDIIGLWLGKDLNINWVTIFLMGVLIVLIMWSTMHSDFLMGISSYRLSFITIGVGIGIKFGFLFFMQTFYDLSLINILISSLLGYLFFCISAPIYVRRLLNVSGEKYV